MISEKEIQKNNRLADLKTLYKKRQSNDEENDMAAKKNIGTCELCGKNDTMVKRNHGIDVCAMCSTVQARVKNDPEKVIAEVKRMHGGRYFPVIDVKSTAAMAALADIRAALGVDEKPILSDLAKIAGDKVFQVIELGKQNNLLSKQCSKSEEDVEQLRQQNELLATQLMEVEASEEALEKDNNRLMDENMELIGSSEATLDVKINDVEAVPVSRLLSDSHLLAAVNTLADTLRGVA